jgi:Flp pilus assembly pilin Flp
MEMKRIWNFLKDEDGLELPEYAVMGALIILGLTATIGLLQTGIANSFTQITAELP